jgi:hypothetical protein
VDDPKTIWVGLSLDMATDVLNCHLSGQGYVAEAYHIDPEKISQDKARKLMKEAVLDEKSRVMINYDRGGIGQGTLGFSLILSNGAVFVSYHYYPLFVSCNPGATGHGHFSPIGAYNHEMDAFLIMDVAKYKFPPVWVPSSNLYHGVGSLDFCASFQYPEDATMDLHAMGYSGELGIALNCQPGYRGFVIVKPKER